MMCVGKRYFDDLRPCALQPCYAFGPELVDLSRHAVDAIFLRDADPPAFEVAGERRFIIGNGKIERGGILRIETRHFLEQYGALEHVRGQRSEELRVGKDCVRTCKSRWLPYQYKKTQHTNQMKIRSS